MQVRQQQEKQHFSGLLPLQPQATSIAATVEHKSTRAHRLGCTHAVSDLHHARNVGCTHVCVDTQVVAVGCVAIGHDRESHQQAVPPPHQQRLIIWTCQNKIAVVIVIVIAAVDE